MRALPDARLLHDMTEICLLDRCGTGSALDYRSGIEWIPGRAGDDEDGVDAILQHTLRHIMA